MKKMILIPLLLAAGLPAFCQFNTIKKIKILPQIQIDSVTVDTEDKESQPTAYASAIMKEREDKTGPLVSMPLLKPIINSSYGKRTDPITGKEKFHQGIDFKSHNDTVMVIMPGKVKKVAYSRTLGNYIEVEHGRYSSLYAHLSFVMISKNAVLSAGQAIGITGSTGRSTGKHLHFSLKYNGRIVNPVPVLDLIYRTVESNGNGTSLSLN